MSLQEYFNYNINISTSANIVLTNCTIPNIVNTNTSTGSLNSINLLSTFNTLTNLIYTSATGTSLNLTGLSATNLTTTNLTTSNIQVSGNMTVGGNLTVVGSLTSVNVTSINVIDNNITAGSLNANAATITNLFFTNGSVSSFSSTNITTTNLVSNFTSLGNLTSSTGTFANKVGGSQTVGTIVVTTSASLIGNTNTIGNIFTTGGNVGINTTSPNAILDIQKNGSAVINLQNTGTGASQLQLFSHLDSNNYFQTTGDVLFTAMGQTTTRNLRLTTGGNVLIGATNTFSPVSMLTINGGNGGINVSQASIAFSYAPTPGFYHFIGSRHNATVGSNQNSIDFYLYNSTGATGSSAPNFGNVNSMSVTATGVGIFNSNPSTTLDVNGNIRINTSSSTTSNRITTSATDNFIYTSNTVGHYSLMWAIDQATGVGPMSYLSGYGGQRFFTLGQPRMVIDVNGNVGINTTNPSFNLDVNGSGHYSGSLLVGLTSSYNTGVSNNNNLATATLTVGSSGGSVYFRDISQSIIQVQTYVPGVSNSGQIQLQPLGGNVGINTTSPAYTLDVAGTGRFTGAITQVGGGRDTSFVATATGTGQAGIALDSTAGGGNRYNIYSDPASKQLQFFNVTTTNSSLNLDSRGNFGIGLSNPQFPLDVNGSGRFSGDIFLRNNRTSLSTNGYTMLPGGILMNWGLVNFTQTNTQVNGTVTFSSPFSATVYSVTATIADANSGFTNFAIAGGNSSAVMVFSLTSTTFNWSVKSQSASNTANSFSWISIGAA